MGLDLQAVAATERLQGGGAFGGMCTHKVALTSAQEIDGALVDWLKQAYDQAE